MQYSDSTPNKALRYHNSTKPNYYYYQLFHKTYQPGKNKTDSIENVMIFRNRAYYDFKSRIKRHSEIVWIYLLKTQYGSKLKQISMHQPDRQARLK